MQSVKDKAEEEASRLHTQLEAALREARTDHEVLLAQRAIGALSPHEGGAGGGKSATSTASGLLAEQKEARRVRSPRRAEDASPR